MQQTKTHTRQALRAKEAAKYLGIGESTFWRWVKQRKLPQGRHLSPRVTVWTAEELDAVLEQAAKNEN